MIPAAAKGKIEALRGYRAVVILYASLGLLLALLFARVSRGVEVNALKAGRGALPALKRALGCRAFAKGGSQALRLFALDAFGGGFVLQSFAAYWFYLRCEPRRARSNFFFGANLFAGVSALAASRLASRFGLVKTMVFTHLPSNVLLILTLAISMLLLRFSISQMDVPTRQSYLMGVVSPEERSAAAASPAWGKADEGAV